MLFPAVEASFLAAEVGGEATGFEPKLPAAWDMAIPVWSTKQENAARKLSAPWWCRTLRPEALRGLRVVLVSVEVIAMESGERFG